MFGSEESRVPNHRISLGLNLEQAFQLGTGNAVRQLWQNYHTLSNEVAQITNNLREALAHLREDSRGGRRHSRHQQGSKRFEALNFDGSLNLDSYPKWV